MKENVWKYFKEGDVITDEAGGIWEGKFFEIKSFHGNKYQPLVLAHFLGKPKTNTNACNFNVRNIKLINARERKLRNIPQTTLLKLMQKGNEEAKREFIIRTNSKKIGKYV